MAACLGGQVSEALGTGSNSSIYPYSVNFKITIFGFEVRVGFSQISIENNFRRIQVFVQKTFREESVEFSNAVFPLPEIPNVTPTNIQIPSYDTKKQIRSHDTKIINSQLRKATKQCGWRLSCVWPSSTLTTSDFTTTSFHSFSHPYLPFLCVAGSYGDVS